MAFAFGVNLSIARVGGVVNNVLSPYITANIGILFAMWIGAVVCAASVLSVILAWPIDYTFDLDIAAFNAGRENKLSAENLQSIGDKDNSYGSAGQDLEGASGVDSNASTVIVDAAGGGEPGTEGYGKYLTWTWWRQWWAENPAKLTFAFWLLTAICLIIYSAVLPFNNVASTLLLERDYFKNPPSDCPLHYNGQCQSLSNAPNFSLTDTAV